MIVIYSIKILWLLLKTQIRSQTQYRLSFLADVFTTAIFSSIYFLAFALILQRFETVAGWTLGEIAFLVGMMETSFAFMDLLFSGFDPDSFSPMVRMGSLDQFMVRPVSLTIQVLGSRLILRRMGRGHYSVDTLLRAVEKIHGFWPVMGLGCDIIVGFPGEEERDVEELCRFLQDSPMTYAHVFPYSRRPGTPAAVLWHLSGNADRHH